MSTTGRWRGCARPRSRAAPARHRARRQPPTAARCDPRRRRLAATGSSTPTATGSTTLSSLSGSPSTSPTTSMGSRATSATAPTHSTAASSCAHATAMGFLFGIPIRDIDCDFRLMRADHVHGLRLEKDSGLICVELVRGLGELDARCVEVEVDHFECRTGSSQFFRPRRILWSCLTSRRCGPGRSRCPHWRGSPVAPRAGRFSRRPAPGGAPRGYCRDPRQHELEPDLDEAHGDRHRARARTGSRGLSTPARPASRTPSPPGTKKGGERDQEADRERRHGDGKMTHRPDEASVVA